MNTATAEVSTVPADNIVATVQTSTAKIIGAGSIAKANGQTIGTVKAAHALQQGSTGTLNASINGKNRAGTLHALAEKRLSSLVHTGGNIDYAQAMLEITGSLSAVLAYSYPEDIRADGKRIVKRQTWLDLHTFLKVEALQRGKTGKPTPRARACNDALKVWHAIQDRADTMRAESQARLTE